MFKSDKCKEAVKIWIYMIYEWYMNIYNIWMIMYG